METDYTYPCPWLDDSEDPTRAAIARWSALRVGLYESPEPGSNRSGLIDLWNENSGAQLGSPWCASFASEAWRENGVSPLGDASCQDWHQRAIAAGRFVKTPGVGDLALFAFGAPGVADHCGIVIRITPTVETMEGNTDRAGSREGVGVFCQDRMGHGLLGYVSLGRP